MVSVWVGGDFVCADSEFCEKFTLPHPVFGLISITLRVKIWGVFGLALGKLAV